MIFFIGHAVPSSPVKSMSENKENDPSTSKGMTGGSLMSLKSQDSIGTSSSICGDNVSITSSNRRTSGSFVSASRRYCRNLEPSQHVVNSPTSTISTKTIEGRETKRSSISSSQSQGNYTNIWIHLYLYLAFLEFSIV